MARWIQEIHDLFLIDLDKSGLDLDLIQGLILCDMVSPIENLLTGSRNDTLRVESLVK